MSKNEEITAAWAAHRAATTLSAAEKAEQEDYCWKEGDYLLLDYYRTAFRGEALTPEQQAEVSAARARIAG